jgi:hypothetical protein
MPSTGLSGFLLLGAALLIGILIGRNWWLNRSPVVSLVCTGGELTTNTSSASTSTAWRPTGSHYGSPREATNSNPDLSMTLYLNTHLVQVHVTNNEPIEARMTETADDIHFESDTLFGDLNRLTGIGRVYVTADDGRKWHWDAVQCARHSQKF